MHFNQSMVLVNTSDEAVFVQFAEPPALRLARLVILSMIIIGSILGNALVIRAVAAVSPGNRTITYYLVTNMALAELVSTCCLPFIYTYLELASWPFGNICCHAIVPLQIMAGLVVTSSLATIAGYRCSVVLRPMHIRNGRMKPKAAFAICIALWIISIAVVLPSFINNREVDSPYNIDVRWCLTLFPDDSLITYPSKSYRTLIIFHFMLNYVASAVVMVVAYGIVIFHLGFETSSRHAHPARRVTGYANTTLEEESSTESLEMEGNAQQAEAGPENKSTTKKEISQSEDDAIETKEDDTKERRDLFDYEIDILKMFYAIVLIFVLCYFPYQVFFLLENFGELSWRNFEYFDITRAYVFLLTCVPSALHPVCYGLMSKFYAKELSRVCCLR